MRGAGGKERWTRIRLLLAVGMAAACAGDGGTGPSASDAPPLVELLSPASATPDLSPLTATLRGSGFRGARVEADPPLAVELVEVEDARIRLRIDFQSAAPGSYRIRVATDRGTDDAVFTVESLGSRTVRESRALWVSRWEYEAPDDIARAMERAAGAGFNQVYLQVRGNGDAFYRSSLEPWSPLLGGALGADPGWDPLGVAVAEARSRGLELHAWINAFTGWSGPTPPAESTPRHLFLEHPDWVMVDRHGEPMPYAPGVRWMTPGHPGVRTRLAAVSAEIARRYPVAGIHLDFIRYPDSTFSYDAASLAAYDSARAAEPGLDYAEMRRRFVTWSVAEVRDSLRSARDGVRLSAAVWGIHRNERSWAAVSTGWGDRLQDPRAWDHQGVIDVVVPMVYWTTKPVYGSRLDFAYLADEHARSIAAPVQVGIFVPALDAAALNAQVARARLAGAEGVSLFSFSSLEDAGHWDALREGAFRWPATLDGARTTE